MTAMTHDDFLKLLAELEPPRGESLELSAWLPAEAARHAADCEDCARAAEALLLLAGDEQALFDEPGEDYWAGFDDRLNARLETVDRPQAATAAPAWRRALRVAAVIAAAAGLAGLALRGLEPEKQVSIEPPPVAPVEQELPLEEILAAWSDEPALPLPGTERAFAAPETDLPLPGLLDSPAGDLLDELSLELDDAQAAELARRLRSEISS